MRAMILAAVLVLGSGGAVAAGDWRYVSASDNIVVGADFSTVRSIGGAYGARGTTKVAWTVWVPVESREIAGEQWDYRLSQTTINCDTDTIQIGRSVHYRTTSSSPVYTDDDAGRVEPIVPDTLGFNLRTALCDGGPNDSGLDTARHFATAMLLSEEELLAIEAEVAAAASETADAAANAAAIATGAAVDPNRRRAPPCRDGASECEPAERAWTPENAPFVGETVTRDGWILPGG